jgi:hypothetical protein
MKYFTPDLICRFGSEDDVIADAADAEWDEQMERYDRHLERIAPHLTPSVRAYNELLLHDAVVQSMSRHGDRLVMVLRKDIPPRDVVIATYSLAGEPAINKEALPPEHHCSPMQFLYDELDVTEEGGERVFTQSIIFSNGWEMQLRFRDVEVTLAEPIYPVPAAVPATASVSA